jgi:hypothetical protein
MQRVGRTVSLVREAVFIITVLGLLLFGLSHVHTLAADQVVAEPGALPLRVEGGVHFGSPAKLSGHASYIAPVLVDKPDHCEGIELLGEVGIGSGRLAAGWGRRRSPYYNGWSINGSILRTWDPIADPLGPPPNHTLISVGARVVSVLGALRVEALYDLDEVSGAWALGSSFGFAM